MTKPFIKWAGGKRQLLPELLKRVPASFNAYHEPFLGGGALFFALDRGDSRSYLSDANEQLITVYQTLAIPALRDKVIDALDALRADYTEQQYYRMRASKPINDVEATVKFIYLNKTAFNGLYRVNSRGEFNVPWGKYKNPTICDTPVLIDAANALRGALIRASSFEIVLEQAQPNDFAYFDPPYVPVKADSFTAYTAKGFTWDDQVRLRDVARELKARGVHVLLSNSGSPLVRELYEGFTIEEVFARRSVNSNGGGRGPVAEVLIS